MLKQNAQADEENKIVSFRSAMRNTVYQVMLDRGYKEVEASVPDYMDWDIFWSDIHWIHDYFNIVQFKEHQRINHFRNHYELTRKDLLIKNMKRMIKKVEKEHGKDLCLEFEFVCTSFVLPREHALFNEEFKKKPGSIWIMKPVGGAQGKGIFLINKLSQISQWKRKDPRNKTEEEIENYIVQRYIDNPYLIGGKKFDIRLYVLVTSYRPLVVYIHRNGFCRFSNHEFTMDAKDISNLYIHATNVAIQKTSPNYDSDNGCKWLLRNLRQYLNTCHGHQAANKVFVDMEALVVRSLQSVQKIMIQDKHCFELYGYDILIDEQLKLWLLEVNASPSLSAETSWDRSLKVNMLNDVFDVVDVEKIKQVGGFDLVYNDGAIERAETLYTSYIGGYCPF